MCARADAHVAVCGNHPYGNQASLVPPSHPNSPFSLVHDHLEQRAHASVNARASGDERRHVAGVYALEMHAWLHDVTRRARGVFLSSFSDVPNSSSLSVPLEFLPSRYIAVKSTVIVNFTLSTH